MIPGLVFYKNTGFKIGQLLMEISSIKHKRIQIGKQLTRSDTFDSGLNSSSFDSSKSSVLIRFNLLPSEEVLHGLPFPPPLPFSSLLSFSFLLLPPFIPSFSPLFLFSPPSLSLIPIPSSFPSSSSSPFPLFLHRCILPSLHPITLRFLVRSLFSFLSLAISPLRHGVWARRAGLFFRINFYLNSEKEANAKILTNEWEIVCNCKFNSGMINKSGELFVTTNNICFYCKFFGQRTKVFSDSFSSQPRANSLIPSPPFIFNHPGSDTYSFN